MSNHQPGRQPGLPHCYNDLGATLTEAWRMLTNAAANRQSPIHTISLATAGLDGWPQVRTVVLRRADPTARTVRFHADQRSTKVHEIIANPAVQILAYDVQSKIQLRLTGQATVHSSDALADTAWGQAQPISRMCYRQHAAPGSPSLDPALLLATADHDGRANFSVVDVNIHQLDWVFLSTRGNRRANFAWDVVGHVTSTWIAP